MGHGGQREEHYAESAKIEGARPGRGQRERENGNARGRPYGADGALADVFVVTSGGLGSVGISSATQRQGVVTINFSGGGVCPGATSYFFGLTSARTTLVPNRAILDYSAGGMGVADARTP